MLCHKEWLIFTIFTIVAEISQHKREVKNKLKIEIPAHFRKSSKFLVETQDEKKSYWFIDSK